MSGTEEKLIKAVLDLQNQSRDLEQPLDKELGLKSIRVPTGFRIEQVAAEPLVRDPINISFGMDGKVWVLEMPDYPNGENDLDESFAWRIGIKMACWIRASRF